MRFTAHWSGIALDPSTVATRVARERVPGTIGVFRMDSNEQDIAALRQRVTDFLAAHDPTTMAEPEFWRARFDAGLAWVHYPHGLGGLGMPREYQPVVDQLFAESGVGESGSNNNGVGLGMAAPTILAW